MSDQNETREGKDVSTIRSNPTSAKKVAANRRNAQHSTGPRTPNGKKAVRLNALRHGLLAKDVVVPTGDALESADEFEQMLTQLLDDLQPVGFLEIACVQRIAVSLWRKRRAIRAEAAEIDRYRQEAEHTVRHRCLAPHEELVRTVLRRLDQDSSLHNCFSDDILRILEERNPLNDAVLWPSDQEPMANLQSLARVARKQLFQVTQTTDPGKHQAASDMFERTLIELRTMLKSYESTINEKLELMKHDMAIALGVAAIPSSVAIERLMRYENTYDRELARAMADLQHLQERRLQAAQQGRHSTGRSRRPVKRSQRRGTA